MQHRLDEPTWRARAAAHATRADALLADHIYRRDRGLKHPIEDFLFSYYHYKPAQLRTWHPGAEFALEGAAERSRWRYYRADHTTVSVDVEAFATRQASILQRANAVLRATQTRPMVLSCFGMHEWAMVYRTSPDDIRHSGLPLRLGHSGTDEVVEAHDLRCTHFDAFRFFTEPAKPLNLVALKRDTQASVEQPGCLHAGMDLYKWAHKLSPLISSELVLHCFELARDIRVLDMRASPYDVRSLGHAPVAVETPEGKAEYVRGQREFADRAAPLRLRLLDEIDAAMRLLPACQAANNGRLIDEATTHGRVTPTT